MLTASAFWGAVASGITQIPHENPSTAESHFNFAPPLFHYSEIFGQVADKNYLEARALIQELKPDYAHLPEEMIFIMARYNDLTTDLTQRLDILDGKLDECEQLLSQNKLDEASVKLGETRGLVGEAAGLIENISMATDELLELLPPFVSPQEAGAVNEAKARLQKALQRLSDLEAWYRDRLNAIETEAKGKEDLSATELTLNISPAQVWVGEQAALSGTLKAGGIPLPNRNLSISLEGGHFATATTTKNGSYEASFALPYWYTPEIEAQAFYLPQGDDKSSFLASSSTMEKIAVLFYPTSLKIETPEKAYPGLLTEISGKVSSEGNIAGRNINGLLDGEPLFETTTDDNGSFQHQVLLAEETWVGRHKLSIAVAPEDKSRSAGTSSDKALTVLKVTPELKVHAPTVIVMPQRIEVAGEVHSPLPLQGAAVTLEMAGVSTTTNVDEGEFELDLDLPLKLNVVGFEEMKLNLAPSEPWQLPTECKASIFVINSLYLGIVLAALVLAGVLLTLRRPRILRQRGLLSISPEELQAPDIAMESYLPKIKPGAGDIKGVILQAYYMAAAGVQRLARVLFKPQMTLREFLSQVTPTLGRFAELFAKLTSLAEKALYSRHILGKDEASLAQRLAAELRRIWLIISH